MKHLLISLSILTLTACGDGGSDSSSSGGSTSMIYNGAQTATISGSGISQPLGSIPFSMTVSGSDVFITDTANPPVEARGTLSGSNFTATSNSSGTVDGVTCTFNWTYSGTISGTTASGGISGPVVCTSAGTTLTFSTSNGSFTGNLASASSLSTNSLSTSKSNSSYSRFQAASALLR